MKPLHFLVTDDDVDKRLLITRALAREFPRASIFECHSGREALDYFAANVVDAIVTNHNMHPVNGIELAPCDPPGSGFPSSWFQVLKICRERPKPPASIFF